MEKKSLKIFERLSSFHFIKLRRLTTVGALMQKKVYKSPFDYLYSYNGKFYFLCPSVMHWRYGYFDGLLNTRLFEEKLRKINKSRTFPKLFPFVSIKLISFVYGILNYFYHRYFKLEKLNKIRYPIKIGYCRIDSYEEKIEKEDIENGAVILQTFSIYIGDASLIVSGIRDIRSNYSHRNKKIRFAKVLSNLEKLFRFKDVSSPFGISSIVYDYDRDSIDINICFRNTVTNNSLEFDRKKSFFNYVMERLNRYNFFVRLYPSEFVSTTSLHEMFLLFGKSTDKNRIDTLFDFISFLYSKDKSNENKAFKKDYVPNAWAYRLIQQIESERQQNMVVNRVKTISKNMKVIYGQATY